MMFCDATCCASFHLARPLLDEMLCTDSTWSSGFGPCDVATVVAGLLDGLLSGHWHAWQWKVARPRLPTSEGNRADGRVSIWLSSLTGLTDWTWPLA